MHNYFIRNILEGETLGEDSEGSNRRNDADRGLPKLQTTGYSDTVSPIKADDDLLTWSS